MRIHRFSICVAAVLTAWLSTVPLWAADERVAAPIGLQTADEESLPQSSSVGDASATEAADTCVTFGGDDNAFQSLTPSRSRGNVYRMEYDAQLTEIRIWLKIQGSATLYFSVHEVPSSDDACRQYERVTPDVAIQVTHPGTPAYFSTGPLANPVALKAGSDYLIAVTWQSTAVTYYRDGQDYSNDPPFLHGRILGSMAENVPPPLDNQFDTCIFETGAYFMQLCFEPVEGACCSANFLPGTGCQEVKQTSCVSPGSYFYGERVSCAEVFCDFGACCLPCGTCKADYASGACSAEGGAHHWSGVEECPTPATDLCPVITGACCNSVGDCAELCRDDCLALGHTYLGDGTTCESNMCRGACCIPGQGCTDRTGERCRAITGAVYKGDGTSCATLPPELECGGACCYSLFPGTPVSWSCFNAAQRAWCTYLDFPVTCYRGDGTLCASTNCGTLTCGACCLPDGLCINTTEQFCKASWVNGRWVGSGTQCDAAVCAAFQACCSVDHTCELTTQQECTAPGSTYLPGESSCLPSPCPLPTGACCSCEGACTLLTEDQCLAQNRVYAGDAVSCPAAACEGLGGCCLPAGDCLDSIEPTRCGYMGGTYAGDCIACDLAECPTEYGACCTVSGTCLYVTMPYCDDIGGDFKGVGVGCNPSTCPDGACCIAGECEAPVSPHACDGWYVGNGTDCTQDPCVLGACCVGQTCHGDTVASECAYLGGEFFSGVSCTTCPCDPRGACCLRDGTCTNDVPKCTCDAARGRFAAGTTCTLLVPPCEVIGACCSNGQCTDETEEGCLAIEGTYQGNGTFCEPADLCLQGACCQPDETCSTRTRQLCEREGGVYLGADVDCQTSAVDCTRGACCHSDGTCDEGIPRSACVGRFAAGKTCAEFDPPCVAVGACCLCDGICEDDIVVSACYGRFAAGTDCAQLDPPCEPLGACCHVDGSCVDDVRAALCNAPADRFAECTPCAELVPPCEPVGACCVGPACSVLTQAACGLAGGDYIGTGVSCDPSPCRTIKIVSSDPPNCAIDARQPSNPNGTNAAGWQSVSLTFDGDATGLVPADFSVEALPLPATPPTVTALNPTADPRTVGMQLSSIIPTGKWTCITHQDSATRVCLGYLPADVNADRTSSAADILRVIDNLNGQIQPPYPKEQCDADRSAVCGPADILRVIDLLNGADAYDPWLGRSIPVCPSAP